MVVWQVQHTSHMASSAQQNPHLVSAKRKSLPGSGFGHIGARAGALGGPGGQRQNTGHLCQCLYTILQLYVLHYPGTQHVQHV